VSWLDRLRAGPQHDLPPLVEAPKVADLPAVLLDSGARYLGTYLAGGLEERVGARGLRAHGSVRLRLSEEGLDVVRLAGSFRVPAAALRGARRTDTVASRPVPPNGALVVTWHHGGLVLETAFRLADLNAGRLPGGAGATHKQAEWVRKISKLARKQEGAA
jgi:hypothetical protein